MKKNRTKARLLEGQVCAGVFIQANDPHVVGTIAAAGFDFVHYDLEHSSLDLARLEMLVRTAHDAGITPMARVPGSAKRDILGALEAGAQGLMIPAVESAAEAAEVVRQARYYPEGERGIFYFGYGSGYGRLSPEQHFRSSNEELLVAVQIETAKGVENAREIAAVPGVDCLFLGPGDLSQSLGVPCQWRHPRVAEAIDYTIRAAVDNGRIAGAMPSDMDLAAEWVEKGARYIALGLDMAIFKNALAGEAEAARDRLGWRARDQG